MSELLENSYSLPPSANDEGRWQFQGFPFRLEFNTMWQRHIVSVGLGLSFFVLGALQPQAILLDMPFGLAFYFADLLGMWKPGLLWAVNHRPLAIACWVVWPVLVSMLLGYGIVFVTLRIWRRSNFGAVIFAIAAYSLILGVRVEPGSLYVSYFGYWTANY